MTRRVEDEWGQVFVEEYQYIDGEETLVDERVEDREGWSFVGEDAWTENDDGSWSSSKERNCNEDDAGSRVCDTEIETFHNDAWSEDGSTTICSTVDRTFADSTTETFSRTCDGNKVIDDADAGMGMYILENYNGTRFQRTDVICQACSPETSWYRNYRIEEYYE